MKRELNPSLFGDQQTDVELGRSIAPFEVNQVIPSEYSSELKALRHDLTELEKDNAIESERILEASKSYAEHFAKLLERLSDRVVRLEAVVLESENESSDQKDMNQKIENLLERHNQIVRNFENKMVHLTRILSEQEIQILNTRSALDEAHREIARLKN